MNAGDAWIIDPPVGPFDRMDALLAWREELRQMPSSEAREVSLDEVAQWIRLREEFGD